MPADVEAVAEVVCSECLRPDCPGAGSAPEPPSFSNRMTPRGLFHQRLRMEQWVERQRQRRHWREETGVMR